MLCVCPAISVRKSSWANRRGKGTAMAAADSVRVEPTKKGSDLETLSDEISESSGGHSAGEIGRILGNPQLTNSPVVPGRRTRPFCRSLPLQVVSRIPVPDFVGPLVQLLIESNWLQTSPLSLETKDRFRMRHKDDFPNQDTGATLLPYLPGEFERDAPPGKVEY